MSRSAEQVARAAYEDWRVTDDRVADTALPWEHLRPEQRALYVRLVVAGRNEVGAEWRW